MTNSLVARSESPELTVDDLLEEGFSPEEIEQLKELRQEYPYIEYVDSGRQWQRLLFLKWRYAKGDLRRE